MLVSQQKRPRSGDQRRMNGRVALITRKQTLMGPNVAPLLNSCRLQELQLGASVTRPETCRLASISWRSSGDACVEGLELRNLTCMLTTSPVRFTPEIQSVKPCTSAQGPGVQFSGVRGLSRDACRGVCSA